MRFFIVYFLIIVAWNLELKLPEPEWFPTIVLIVWAFIAMFQDMKELNR